MSRVWFVTGSSTGLGRTTVERILAQGDRVVATLRTPSALSDLSSKYPPSQLLVLQLDVTSPASAIAAAFASAVKAFGHIDIVLSNAGGGGTSAVAESVPEEKARQNVELNFWGSTKVALEALKVFRDVNSPRGGIFFHVSTGGGIEGQPLMAYYSAGKFAAEGWLDAFSRELDPKWNIKVHIINPGGFDTNFGKNAELLPLHPAYSSLDSDHPVVRMKAAQDLLDQGVDFGLPKPDIFVDALLQVVERRERGEDIPFRIPVGHDSLSFFRHRVKTYSDSVDKYNYLSKDCKFMAPASEGFRLGGY